MNLEQVKNALAKAIEEKKRGEELIKSLGPAIVSALEPAILELVNNNKASNAELLQAIQNVQINVPKSDIPQAQVDVKIPEIKVPTPQVTVHVPEIVLPEFPKITIPPVKVPKPEVTVNVPEIRIPKMEWPKDNMPIEGWVKLQGVDLGNPLPVQLRDASGKPVNLFENLTQIVGGGGGFRRVKIDNTASEPIPISGTISATFSADFGLGEVGSQTLRTVAATDSIWSVNIVGGSASGAVGQGDSASALRTIQAGDSISSVKVTGFDSTVGATIVDSSGVAYSGSNPLPTTASVTLSAAVGQGDGSAALRTIQAGDTVSSVYVNNPVAQGDAATALRVVVAGNSDVSVTATQTGTWNVNVNGALNSVLATGTTLSDAVDDGDAPIKIGGVAVTANPTAVAGGDRVRFTSDDLGRQLVRPVQVRDLIVTAYATLSNGTETTFLAASAGFFQDLVYVVAANNSDAAVTVHIRPVTAGNIVLSLQVPANGTAGIASPIPLPQSDTGNNWTADMADITGTSVFLTGLFSKEL